MKRIDVDCSTGEAVERPLTAAEIADFSEWTRPDPQIVVSEKLLKVREFRELTINRINGIAARLSRKGNATIQAVADDAVEAMLDLTKNLPSDPEQVDVVVVQRYAAIVAPLKMSAPELLSAFASMDT